MLPAFALEALSTPGMDVIKRLYESLYLFKDYYSRTILSAFLSRIASPTPFTSLSAATVSKSP